MTDDLVYRLREKYDSDWDEYDELCQEAAAFIDEQKKRIEALEKKNKLLEQTQASYTLAGLGIDVVAAYNSGLEALKAGCKEERLRAERAEKRNKELEAALDVVASNNGLALSWMSTAPMPLERYKDNCYEMMNIARSALGEKKDG